jgi:hypothetical protein
MNDNWMCRKRRSHQFNVLGYAAVMVYCGVVVRNYGWWEGKWMQMEEQEWKGEEQMRTEREQCVFW